ncbi:hypothetical protein [Parvicella tangerina]|uniref:Uncharacterized protein n=1 Tax=Parvicella tangerina TaxID=2829795 RepID=A0A916JP31_9FLAO|nr:hypothetical protein [Parvicella tangerina]CAG5084869.1 hypothetical protein CRYO30217_02587 [Parvicella tangerina]
MEKESRIISDLEKLLSEGADERIYLDDQGLTKYGTPLIRNNYINRGSCTCSAARNNDIKLMYELLESHNSSTDWISLKHTIEKELKAELGWDELHNFDLFFAPSGTDLVYYPLLFSQLLSPHKKIQNLITCIEELGSGTRLSSLGKFYANHNQFGETVDKGGDVIPNLEIQTHFFQARDEFGDIRNNAVSIRKVINEHPEDSIIVNLVYGSKSGIEDDLRMIDEISANNVQWVVDICQFRHSREILHDLISKGAMVMITGSKFYESSPFSGALLVPNAITQQLLKVTDWNAVNGYSRIFSKYDVPLSLMDKAPFKDKINQSALLRWACAIETMRAFNELDEKDTEEKTNHWRDKVYQLLKTSNTMELMPHQELTNNSIVSFRVYKNNKYLNQEELRSLYFSIVKDYYGDKQEFEHLTIGQPVSYGEKAFLRLAIGAKSILQFVKQDETQFATDEKIISILEQKIAEFEIHHT